MNWSTCWRPSRRSLPSRIRLSPTSPSAARTPCSAGGSSSTSCAVRASRARVRAARDAFERSLADHGLTLDPAEMTASRPRGCRCHSRPTRRGGQPAAAGGYLGAENQMIRVMVAGIDAATGEPTIVWGFDDASFLYRVQRPPRAPGHHDPHARQRARGQLPLSAAGAGGGAAARRRQAHRDRLHRVVNRLRHDRHRGLSARRQNPRHRGRSGAGAGRLPGRLPRRRTDSAALPARVAGDGTSAGRHGLSSSATPVSA